jgi:hypothetical protein
MRKNVYKDLARVFLDVIKYTLTGVILSSFIGHMENMLMLYVTISAVIFSALGIYLFFSKLGEE